MPNLPRWRSAATTALATSMLALLALANAAAAQTGWSEQQSAKRARDYARLTSDQVANSVSVQDDALEQVATFTTEAAYRFRGGFTDRIRADAFLRALLTKRTGTAVFQVYATLAYSGEPRNFTSALYETPDGPQRAELSIMRDAPECAYGACNRRATLAFVVPDHAVRAIAARAGTAEPWRFRFKAESGEDWTEDLPPVEAAGLLQAVERWRARDARP
jgi:hypothetical protein